MSIEFFEKQAEAWKVSHETKAVADIIVRDLIDRESKFILDLGCGKGVLRNCFKKYVPRASVFYIDKAFKMIKGLKEAYPNEFAIRGEGENIPFINEKFDAIIIFNSFPHFDDKGKVLSESYRVLKRKGKLIIAHSMPPEEINKMHREIGGAIANHFLPEKKIFIQMLKKAGFKEIKYFVSNYFYVIGKK
ncbi:MAG: class I SAM-dependent methyltransferase [candidate division WOR-3 bacterium]